MIASPFWVPHTVTKHLSQPRNEETQRPRGTLGCTGRWARQRMSLWVWTEVGATGTSHPVRSKVILLRGHLPSVVCLLGRTLGSKRGASGEQAGCSLLRWRPPAASSSSSAFPVCCTFLFFPWKLCPTYHPIVDQETSQCLGIRERKKREYLFPNRKKEKGA